MTEKVLFVDDEPNILLSYKRNLHKFHDISTAQSGQNGLDEVVGNGPFAVVVSDMRMPGMDGIQFLSQVRKIAPDTVRIMLTGHSDVETAIDAVNEGNIFRFLTKPCPTEALLKSLKAGLEQYRLVTAERELLEKTLGGSVKVLTDVLALVKTEAFGHAQSARRLANGIAKQMKLGNTWELDVAAMLSQVGCVAVPDDVLIRAYKGKKTTQQEMQVFQGHPSIGAQLIASIPRLEGVAEIIAYQEKGFDGSGLPADGKAGPAIPLGSRILKVALAFDRHLMAGLDHEQALQKVMNSIAIFDPEVARALAATLAEELVFVVKAVSINDLVPGTVLAEDVTTADGGLLIPKGHEVTETLRLRLMNFVRVGTIPKVVRVLVREVASESD